MSKLQVRCRWAAISLSEIASLYFPDILPPRPNSPVEHELVAISTTGTLERAETWKKDQCIPNPERVNIYQSWQDMLQNADFDVVYISTQPALHYEMVGMALKCGRNVLLEKPATLNWTQWEKLTHLAKAQNTVLMEAMWTRYQPIVRHVKDVILPQIGEVKRVFIDFGIPIWTKDLPSDSKWTDKTIGAGNLLAQGVYALTWADIALNGADHQPRISATNVVYASSMPIPGVPGEVDDINTIIISKEDPQTGRQVAVAVITTSMTMPGARTQDTYARLNATKHSPSVRIEGTIAQIVVPFPPVRVEEVHIQWYGDDVLDEPGKEKEETILMPIDGWGMRYEADEIAICVARRKDHPTTEGLVIGGEETSRVMRWVTQVREQAGICFDPSIDNAPDL